MGRSKNKAVTLAVSHLMTTCATLAAILLFVGLGSNVLSPALGTVPMPQAGSSLTVALILNIAIILFGWRRSRDLKDALDAHEKAERLAHRNANTDQATGLANRRELMRSLSELIDAGRGGVLLLLDLDHFKRVNDLHGHQAGDRLLQHVADVLRQTAPPGSCCARIGGDEFALLLHDADEAAAVAVGESLLTRLRTPRRIGNVDLQISASVGLAAIGEAAEDETVLRHSDVALYAAKAAGRNALAWFNEELERELSERLSLEEDIRHGIENGEFVPYFQPLIDLRSGAMVGLEALARWKSPTRGTLEPESFLDAAEKTGLVGPLTMSVMEQALRHAKDWPARLKIAINISPIQFRDPALAEQILKIASLTGFPPQRLEVEITEGSMLEDREQVTAIIHSLKNVGVSVALDDFGTGYASLAQLHSFPVDRIKIDRSFITELVKSGRTAAIVNTIASLGQQLNVPLTAEGVESEQVRSALGELGCSEAQGWLFGRAVSAATVDSLVKMSGDRLVGDSDTPAAEPHTKPKPEAGRRRAAGL